MAKKRLGDLLRQEAQKFPDSEANQAQETAPVGEIFPAEVLEATAPESAPEPAPIPAQNNNVELEKTIADLQNSLAKFQEKEDNLHKEIKELKAQLQAEKTAAEQLQKQQLKEVNSLQAELEKAKEAAVQLAEVNSQLSEEIEELKKPKKEPKKEASAIVPQQLERRFLNFPEQRQDDPSDFASTIWLLD